MSRPLTLNPPIARVRLRVPGLYALLALLTFWGVVLIGLGSDDYANLIYLTQPGFFSAILPDPLYNRAPVYALIYALLLRLPVEAAVLIKILVHWLNAVLLARLLQQFKLPGVVAAVAGALVLIWPSNTETLYWLVAGYSIFAVCFGLVGLLLLQSGRYVSSIVLLLLGMLCVESLAAPLLLVCWAVLINRRVRLPWQIAYLSTVAGLYGGYYVGVRRLLNPGQAITQYRTGLGNTFVNLTGWLKMLLGAATSQDPAWIWSHSLPYSFAMLLLPPVFLLLAGAIAAALAWRLPHLIQRDEDALALPPRALALGGLVAVLGIALAALPFLLLSEHLIQSRMTYVATPFVGTLLGLLFGAFWQARARLLHVAALAALAATLAGGIYLHWSAILANYYPARVVSDLIVRDLQQTFEETGATTILLVNDPGTVGSGYAIGRSWAYRSVAAMSVGGSGTGVCADSLSNLFIGAAQSDWCAIRSPGLYSDTRPEIGQPIMQPGYGACVFLGWQNGARVVSQQLRWSDDGPVLDCATNMIRAPLPGEPAPVYHPETSIQAIDDFCDRRCPLPQPIYTVVVRDEL